MANTYVRTVYGQEVSFVVTRNRIDVIRDGHCFYSYIGSFPNHVAQLRFVAVMLFRLMSAYGPMVLSTSLHSRQGVANVNSYMWAHQRR